ncbi:MAG: TRAP transporter substrate-binding protein [Moraxellaceae bacterium]|nr:TRAP transporter substrate-binding protein [Moraxellaceae bacterium]
MFKPLRVAIAAACLMVSATLGIAQEPIVIKFSHVVAPESPKGRAAEFFRGRVAARLGSRVRVEVYPNSTLYKDRDEMEALQLGAVQMLAPSLAKFGPLGLREFEVFDLPYLFDDYRAVHRVTGGPIGERLLDKLEDKGIVGLAYWDNGFKDFSANRPLRKPEDFRGLKMRIQSSAVIDAQMRALGTRPEVMNFSDVRDALRTGMVDGTENPPSNFYTQGMHEVQKYLLRSNHGYLGYAVIVNKRFWDDLPGPIRRELQLAIGEATEFANAIAERDNARALEAVHRSGKTQIIVPTNAERAALKRALVDVHKSQASRVGADLIQAIYRETGFDPARK